MELKPCGFHILVEILPVEEVSAGGIITQSSRDLMREKAGRDVGIVKALGNCAYSGIKGCDAETAEGRAEQWGFKIGDLVEFKRYDGKVPRLAEKQKEYENYRLIADQDVCGVAYGN